MSGPAFFAAARVARRQARMAPGRSLLVLAMIAVPIAGLTGGATLISTAVPTDEERVTGDMGTAELIADGFTDRLRPARLARLLPPGTRVITTAQWNRTEVIAGTLQYVTVREPSIPIDRAPVAGRFVVRDGRAPRVRGEASVDPMLLDLTGLRIGDDLTISGKSLRIVGVSVEPLQMWYPLVVVAPGTFDALGLTGGGQQEMEVFSDRLLIDLPPGSDVIAAANIARREGITEVRTRLQHAATYPRDVPVLTGVSFAGTALVLFGTGLIAAAAFAVGFRRQLRALGLVGATGGEPSHVRAVVLLTGGSIGFVGSVLGAAIGVACAYAATPSLHRVIHALPGNVTVNWAAVIGGTALGTLAAVVAAAWPAGLAARLPVLDALASRLPAPRPPGRLARRGLAVVGIGALLVAASTGTQNEYGMSAGLILMVGGFLFGVPLVVVWVGRLAGRLPAAARLAVRDASRNGRRTGAAIAAAAVALTIPVGVSALSLSEDAFQRRTPWLASDHVSISTAFEREGGAAPPDPTLVDSIRRMFPGARHVRFFPALYDTEGLPSPVAELRADSVVYVEGALVTYTSEGAGYAHHETGFLSVSDEDGLRGLHAEDGIPALRAGRIVAIGPGLVDDDAVRVVLPTLNERTRELDEGERITVPAVEAGRTRYAGEDTLPRFVVSAEGARAIGLRVGDAGPARFMTRSMLIATGTPLSREDVARIRKLAGQYPGTFVRTNEDYMPRLGPLRLAATGGAIGVSLLIVAVAAALVGAESRRDQTVLAAVGAGPGTRRRIVGVRTGLLASLAAAVAIPAGLSPVAVMQAAREVNYPVVIPWGTMAVVALAMPLIAGAGAAVLSRGPRAGSMVRPLI